MVEPPGSPSRQLLHPVWLSLCKPNLRLSNTEYLLGPHCAAPLSLVQSLCSLLPPREEEDTGVGNTLVGTSNNSSLSSNFTQELEEGEFVVLLFIVCNQCSCVCQQLCAILSQG